MAETKRSSRTNERLQVFTQVLSPESHDSESNLLLQETSLERLAWRDLTEEQVTSLMPLTPQELEAKLAEICSCYKYEICLEEASLLDYYVSAFWFAKQVNFTAEQISVFFSLTKILLENIKDRQMPLIKNVEEMKNYMKGAGFANHEKQTGVGFFNIDQARLVIDYVTESLFQHYKLYELLFSAAPEEDHIISQKLLIEVPPRAEFPFPPPLDEGIPEDVYCEFVLESAQPSQSSGDIVAETKDEKKEKPELPDPIHDDVADEDARPLRETLLNNLELEVVKQVLKAVSDDILSEVKNGVQKKLKEREAVILSKLSKR